MRLVPMRFCGFQWRHNPKEISFKCENKLNEKLALGGQAYIQNIGRKNLVIKGSGELYGEDCLVQFESLLSLFKQSKTGVLVIDGLTPIYAAFDSIGFMCRPKPDVIEYSFEFREVSQCKQKTQKTIHKAKEGECLWDVSYLYEIPIDKLVALNTELKRPDAELEGMEVILC